MAQGRAKAGAGRPAGRTTAAPEGGRGAAPPGFPFPPPPPSGRIGAAPGAAAAPPMSAAERPSRGPIGREPGAPRPMGARLPAPRAPEGRAGGGGRGRRVVHEHPPGVAGAGSNGLKWTFKFEGGLTERWGAGTALPAGQSLLNYN